MPTIDRAEGLKINVYSGDHVPPHIHVLYSEFEVLLVIEDGRVYAGGLPAKQMKLAKAWLSENRDWALSTFYSLNPQLP